jgi:hypothetical protein
MEIVIRRATAADAEVVHKIVLLALRETNAQDYPSSVIERLVLTLPDKVASNLETWCAFVAIISGRVVGTGSLNGQTVSSVYVHPTIKAAVSPQSSWTRSKTLRMPSLKRR